MGTLGSTKTLLRSYLGTASDDPQFTATILDPLVQAAYDSILTEITDANPDYLSTVVTLTADSSTSHVYTFSGQSSPITDFARWISVRYTDENGVPLAEARRDELRDIGPDYFLIRGVDEAPFLVTSPDSPAGTALYFEYAYWPVALSANGDSLVGIPIRFHDVVALEAASYVYGLGGEQRLPPELLSRWRDRKAQLMSRVSRRGVQPGRSRLVMTDL